LLLLYNQRMDSSLFVFFLERKEREDISITPRSVLGRSQLVHLGHPLLELVVLAFFVAVSLVLLSASSVSNGALLLYIIS